MAAGQRPRNPAMRIRGREVYQITAPQPVIEMKNVLTMFIFLAS